MDLEIGSPVRYYDEGWRYGAILKGIKYKDNGHHIAKLVIPVAAVVNNRYTRTEKNINVLLDNVEKWEN